MNNKELLHNLLNKKPEATLHTQTTYKKKHIYHCKSRNNIKQITLHTLFIIIIQANNTALFIKKNIDDSYIAFAQSTK